MNKQKDWFNRQIHTGWTILGSGVLLGIIGSIIGGKLGHLIGWGVMGQFSLVGIATAVGGALIFMYAWRFLFGKKG